MAKEFKAREVDLNLSLTALDGKVYDLEPKVPVSGSSAIGVMREWTKAEEDSKGADSFSKIELLAQELNIVYDKPVNFWLENFDIATLSEIVVYVAEAIGGMQKKE